VSLPTTKPLNCFIPHVITFHGLNAPGLMILHCLWCELSALALKTCNGTILCFRIASSCTRNQTLSKHKPSKRSKLRHTNTAPSATGRPYSGISRARTSESSVLSIRWSLWTVVASVELRSREREVDTKPLLAALVRARSHAATFTAYPSGFVFFCKVKSE
jgi:hypothetical protein